MNDAWQDILDRAAEDQRPWLEFLERTWSPAALQREAGLVAAGLAARGLKPGDRVGLLLPNLPVAAAALLAAWRGGLVALPMDPRQSPATLAAWQERFRPAALITLDLATVFERARPLIAGPGCRFAVLARMADQLSWSKRLFSPWLRAGGTVRPEPREELLDWHSLIGLRELDSLLPGGAPALQLPDGTALSRDELAARATALAAPGRRLLGLPLSHESAIDAFLTSLAGGGTLVLSPRLDARSLTKVATAAATVATVE